MLSTADSDSLWTIAAIAFVALISFTLIFLASRYKRCSSDAVLVIFGKVGDGQSSRCIHGGGALIWPLIQDYRFLSLTPLTINIDLKNALSLQNIRINVPSTFTVGVSTSPAIMNNAAERLLGLEGPKIENMAGEIIFGQLRLTIASLTIEQINQDRESFLESIRKNVEPELNKIGLYLINVNITDITDESNYIQSIGKKAASEAINRAKVDVAQQEKIGSIGESEQARDQHIQVAQNHAAAEKGEKAAQAEKRVYIEQQETLALLGEAKAVQEREIGVAQNKALAAKGEKSAEVDQRVFVLNREEEAVRGENTARAGMARSAAELAIEQASAHQRAEVAVREAEERIQVAEAKAARERLNAHEVVRQEIERKKIEIQAAAEAEQTRLVAQGQADATLAKYNAEAAGVAKLLASKAAGYEALVKSCNGDARAAASLLLIEKLEDIVATQVEAIKNLKIDKITVWDSGGGAGGGSSTANFAASLIKSLPPLHEVARMAGIELPEFLGETRIKDQPEKPADKPPSPTISPAPVSSPPVVTAP
jgi:flotillin